MGNKAVMPIVFTSMLFNVNATDARSELVNTKMGVSQTSQVFIDHQASDANGVLTITWDYVEDLFEVEVIETMFEQYTSSITALSEPDQTFQLAVKETDRRLIAEYNRTAEPISQVALQQLFAIQVKKTPDNTAVIFEDDRITYRELNERSNQVAHYLKEQGIVTERLGGDRRNVALTPSSM